MKKIVKIGTLIGMVCSLALAPSMTQAETIEVLEDTKEYVEDLVYSVQRSSLLAYGEERLKKLSSNSISVYGLSQCYKSCDKVYLSIYLERKVDGSYGTYKSWDFSTTDATSLSKSLIVSVPSGYYYRLRGYHAASDAGSDKESVTTLTSGIYVG